MDYCGFAWVITDSYVKEKKKKKVAMPFRKINGVRNKNYPGIREKEGARELRIVSSRFLYLVFASLVCLSLKCQSSRLLCRCIKVEDGAWEGLWECKAAQQTEGHPAGFKQTRLALLFSQKFNQSPWKLSLLMSYKCFSWCWLNCFTSQRCLLESPGIWTDCDGSAFSIVVGLLAYVILENLQCNSLKLSFFLSLQKDPSLNNAFC